MARQDEASDWLTAQRQLFTPPHSRRDRVRALLTEHHRSGLLAFGPRVSTWLTGYHRYGAGPQAVFLDQDEIVLFVSADERDIAESALPEVPVRAYPSDGFGKDLTPWNTLFAEVRNRYSQKALRASAFCGQWLPSDFDVRQDPQFERELVEMQMSKDLDEVERIEKAYACCAVAQESVRRAIDVGVSEIELFAEALAAATVFHGGPVEFSCDLLAGVRTADICNPAAVASLSRLNDGDGIVADIAVGVDGYWADCCETYVCGQNDEIARVRRVLRQVVDSVAAELRPGASAPTIFSVASELCRSAGLTYPELPHHAGHGVGLSGFEPPHLVPSETASLQAGQIVALEPGVYTQDVGVRVERLFAVSAEGGIPLPWSAES